MFKANKGFSPLLKQVLLSLEMRESSKGTFLKMVSHTQTFHFPHRSAPLLSPWREMSVMKSVNFETVNLEGVNLEIWRQENECRFIRGIEKGKAEGEK